MGPGLATPLDPCTNCTHSKLVVLQGNYSQTQCMRQNTRGYEFSDGVAACQGWEGKVGVYDTHAVWKRVLIELVFIYIHCLAQS